MKEFDNAVMQTIYESMLEREKNYIYPEESICIEFENELRKLGFEFELGAQTERLCRLNPTLTRDIILKYYHKAILENEKAHLVSCLIAKENKDLVPFFLNEYVKPEYNTMYNSVISEIGNFLMVNADEKYIQEYINILNMPEKDMVYGKWYILMVCERLKSEKAIDTLLELLKKDSKYTLSVLNALRKYKNPRFLSIFEQYINDKNTDIRNACKKGIASIEKLQNKEKN